MNLGTQYYRAPFPDPKYWDDDLQKMRDSGLNTVQLWISWGWVEASPGKFQYDDYDQLIELADKHKLGVVLSTIAEIQPNWIHRLIPDCELVDQNGQKVCSCSRNEHHFGLTPGGCTDHPEVWSRMKQFIQETGKRYANLTHLRGWDIWNELRWNVCADALVCYCPDTMRLFRQWLHFHYQSLENLNKAWIRRYNSWDDVIPRKSIDGVYTELMSFQHFLTSRANLHAQFRYQAMREVDPRHIITAHGAHPSALYTGDQLTYALDRGNDYFLADELDGIGCSSFPQWFNIDDADFGMRIDMVKSAANDKKVWLSELQGGRAATGFNLYDPVRADQQQRWIWNGLGCGADTILFWCWRDEVFGRESNGFGLSGNDGYADERLAAMKITGKLLESYADLFDNYRPDPSEVGLFFSPQSYYLAWAQEGHANRINASLTGYGRALTRLSMPPVYVEEQHLDCLDKLKVLILPQVIVTDQETEEKLLDFVNKGGTLVVESECGAFSSTGFYRYPQDRFLSQVGITEIGRRNLTGELGNYHYNGQDYLLGVEQWQTPVDIKSACVVQSYGKGKVIHLSSYLGSSYRKKWNPAFENFLSAIISDAGVQPAVKVLSPERSEKDFIYLKSGKSGEHSLLFVFFPVGCERAEVILENRRFSGNSAKELFTEATVYTCPDRNGRRCMSLFPGRFQVAIYVD